MASEGQVQRTILRLVQKTPGLQRTLLSVQVRSHSATWDDTLRDLIARGMIIEDSVVKQSKKNRRAVIVYRLNDHLYETSKWPAFEDLSPKEVGEFVDRFSLKTPEELSSGLTAATA